MSAAHDFEPNETDRLLYALEPVLAKYRDSKKRRESLHLHKALRLAPSLEMCEALLRGEKVPVSKLDPRWARAYGIRR